MGARFASFRRVCFYTVLALALLMILAIGTDRIEAQQSVGSLSGRVTRDSGGAGISSVRIDVYTTNWSFVESVWTTDSSGNYTAGGLPAGNYYLATYNQQGYIDEYYSNVIKSGSSWPPVGVTSVGVVIGSDTPNINFGLSVGGSISGRVVKDSDGTAGIPNVEIDVYDTNWRYLNSTFTDASGYYAVRGLPGGSGFPTGSYYLGTWNQQGYVDEYYNNIPKSGSSWPPSGATAVIVTDGFDTPNINFGLSGGGSISGQVVNDSGGAGIQNIEIDVYDNTWKRLNSAVTDASGYYTVGGLSTGSYYLGTVNQQGYTDEYYNNIIKAMSSWPPAGAAAVSVTGLSDTPNINFGLSWGGSISGRVVSDSGGAGIPGVEIEVYGNNWSRLSSAVTDASGYYTVGGLPTGSYYLRTLNYHGYIDEYYDNAATTGGATSVGVTAGLNTAGINFGLAQSGSMSGRVVSNSTGTGIPGIQISVYSSGWNPVQQATTDSSGRYVIGGLPAGSYYVGTWNQQGYINEYYDNATSSGGATLVGVTAGLNTANIDFGLALEGRISGRVTRSSDGAGIQNVNVTIYNSGWNYITSVGTDLTGNYTVGDLVAGNYYVGTSNDQGYLDEYYDNVLVMGSTWPPAGAAVVNVSAGSNVSNINFGLAKGGSISGRVTRNLDGAGIRNIHVRVYDTGWRPLKTSTTDGSGNYTISGLVAGNYYLLTSNNQGYINEYYDNTLSAGAATLVTVTLGSDTPDINFCLPLILGNPAPSVSAITPSSGATGKTLNITNLAGTGFLVGATVKLSKSGSADINATSVVVVSSTRITCAFNLTGAVVGQWNVVVTNIIDAQSATLNNGFTVTIAAPTVISITPSSGVTGTTVNITNLAGTGFLAGATVKLSKSGSADINATSVVVVSSTQITCTFSLVGAAPGPWNTVVTNTDSQFGTLNGGFTVTNPAPTVSGITPASGATGTTVNITNLAGTGFLAGATVKLSKSGSADINATSVVVVSSTQITCTFSLVGAAPGPWNTVVTNTDSQFGTLNGGFTVTNPAPTVSGITPASGSTGRTVNITNLAGTGFLAGATVKLSKSGSADINATSVVVVSSTQITCTFSLVGAGPGPWNTVVTNTDSQFGTLNGGFTVTNPAPTVSGITPNSGAAGVPVNITNLAGTGFLAGATVKLSKSGSADINATSVVVVSSTQIACAFNLADAAAGPWDIVVTNSDSQFGTLNGGFTVYYDLFIINVSKDGLCNSHDPCFPKIQNGIESVSGPSIIEISQDTYTEDISLEVAQVITLKGGWNTNFTSCSSYTTVNGSLTITNGTMILENIILK